MLHVRVAHPMLGLGAGVWPLEQVLVVLAALGDHIAFQGTFNTCPGKGLSLKEVKELGDLQNRQAREQIGHCSWNMRKRIRKTGQPEKTVSRRLHRNHLGLVHLRSMQVRLGSHGVTSLDVLGQVIQLGGNFLEGVLRVIRLPFGQEDELGQVFLLLVLQQVPYEFHVGRRYGVCHFPIRLRGLWSFSFILGLHHLLLVHQLNLGLHLKAHWSRDRGSAQHSIDCIRRSRWLKGLRNAKRVIALSTNGCLSHLVLLSHDVFHSQWKLVSRHCVRKINSKSESELLSHWSLRSSSLEPKWLTNWHPDHRTKGCFCCWGVLLMLCFYP